MASSTHSGSSESTRKEPGAILAFDGLVFLHRGVHVSISLLANVGVQVGRSAWHGIRRQTQRDGHFLLEGSASARLCVCVCVCA